jgi:hypothetical protein
VEKNVAMGRHRGTKVKAIFPTSPRINQTEISLVTRSSVILKSSKVSKKLMKNTVLTTSGIINCAAKYRCNKSLIEIIYPKFIFPSRKGKI